MNPVQRGLDLLNLKNRAGSPSEALAAALVLAKHLDKHRLSEAELEAAGKAQPAAFEMDTEPLGSWRRGQIWRWELCFTVCQHFGVACYTQQRGAKRACLLCGRPADIENVRHIFAWLDSETARLCRADCKGATAAYRRSWSQGFVAGIHDVLAAARLASATKSPVASRALTVRSQNASAFLATQIELSSRSVRVSVNPIAFMMGHIRGGLQHVGKHLGESK